MAAANTLHALSVTLTFHTAQVEVVRRALRLTRLLLQAVMKQSRRDEQRHITPLLAHPSSTTVQAEGRGIMAALLDSPRVASQAEGAEWLKARRAVIVEAGGVAALSIVHQQ